MDTPRRYLDSVIAALAFNLARLWRVYLGAFLAVIIVGGLGYYELLAAPSDYPAGSTIVIKKGTPLPAIAQMLADEGVIKRPFVYEALVRLAGGAKSVEAGPYLLGTKTDVVRIARRTLLGESGIPEIKLTIIEGESVRVMAVLIAKKFPLISASDFVAAAGPYEGYLFPDTYYFSPATTANQIVQTMNDNFYTKIGPLQSQIAASGHSLSDIIIMASLVQKEAATPADMKVIAGILWTRISKGIALQVDAPFGYLQGRDEYSPSLTDLSIDSPYNTYEHKGLPPGPIGSPGLDAINAAISPTKTNYLFYLTGRDGLMHYAATYAGHLANEKKYL